MSDIRPEDDANALLARVEALEKANAEERGVWSQLYNELSGDATGSYSIDDLRRVVAKAVERHTNIAHN